MVLLAVQWARLNPGVERSGVGAVDGEELLWEEIAAKGCPLVEDLAVPAFADAAGLSEYQGRKLIREALLLVFLLPRVWKRAQAGQDRKSTRLNSSHVAISYPVFCLTKK